MTSRPQRDKLAIGLNVTSCLNVTNWPNRDKLDSSWQVGLNVTLAVRLNVTSKPHHDKLAPTWQVGHCIGLIVTWQVQVGHWPHRDKFKLANGLIVISSSWLLASTWQVFDTWPKSNRTESWLTWITSGIVPRVKHMMSGLNCVLPDSGSGLSCESVWIRTNLWPAWIKSASKRVKDSRTSKNKNNLKIA